MVRLTFRLTSASSFPFRLGPLPPPALDSCHQQTYTHVLPTTLFLRDLTRPTTSLVYRTHHTHSHAHSQSLPSISGLPLLSSQPTEPINTARPSVRPPLSTHPQQNTRRYCLFCPCSSAAPWLRLPPVLRILRGTSGERTHTHSHTHTMASFSYLTRWGKRDGGDGDNGGLGEDVGDGQYSGGSTYDDGDYSWWWSPVRTYSRRGRCVDVANNNVNCRQAWPYATPSSSLSSRASSSFC